MARSLRRGAGASTPPIGWRRFSPTKRRWRRSAPTILPPRSMRCCRGLCASGSTPRRRRISPRPSGSARADRLRGRAGADGLDPRAGIVRAGHASVHRRRPRAAGDRAAVAGAPAGAGDARSARLLARQLRGRENRDARPLSAPSLAGRSAAPRRRPGAPSGAANNSIFACAFNRPLTIRKHASASRVKAALGSRMRGSRRNQRVFAACVRFSSSLSPCSSAAVISRASPTRRWSKRRRAGCGGASRRPADASPRPASTGWC